MHAMEAPAAAACEAAGRAAEAKAHGADKGGAARGRRGGQPAPPPPLPPPLPPMTPPPTPTPTPTPTPSKQGTVRRLRQVAARAGRAAHPAPLALPHNRDDARHASCSVPQAIGSKVLVGTVEVEPYSSRALPASSAPQCVSVHLPILSAHLDVSLCISMQELTDDQIDEA